jgi:hypothetical protein
MRLVLLLVPRFEQRRIKNIVIRKVLPTIVASLAISIATSSTAPDLIANPNSDDAYNVSPFGLSRQRPAFRKAMSMLADAAPANERLADYYERVIKRVNDVDADAEDTSCVKVIPKRSAARVKRNAYSTVASAMVAHAATQLLSEASSTATDNSFSQQSGANEDSNSSTQQFTVGDLAFETNPAIERWVNYYTTTGVGRRTMTIGIDRSSAYLEMARAEFRNAGVPEDMVWLAFVESVWNPRAVSPAAAGGIWQFIPATATDYGLKVESGNDERADPFKQTRVAAAYLHDLYTIFGDWTLAMAAYNSGEPRVMGAIVKNGNANFWELYDKQLLPKETCNYVPKILAAIKLAGEADIYGLSPQPDPGVASAD